MPQLVPVAVAKIVGAYFTIATGISVTVAGVQAAIFYGLTAAASIAYSSAQSAKLRRQLSTGSIDQGRNLMTRDPIAPRRLIYGQVLVSGTLVFLHTTGANNQQLHMIIAMAGHEVEELGDIYFGDEVVPFNGSGDATGFYSGLVHMGKHLGTSTQSVEASLNADAPAVWTSAHRLRGIAYLYIRLTYSAEKFPNGLPNVRCMVKGKKVFDPRTSTTVWSANAALCAADYLEDSTFGKGVARARIRSADLIEAANICDENITLNPSGTEDRYTCNGTINADQDPDAVLLDLAGAMAGHIVDTGGTWTVRAGAHRTPTLSLTDADLCGGFTVQPRQSRRDTFNRVRGIYISPTTNWAAADFPPIANTTYKAADGGIWLDRDVQFNFTTSPATAQRLAKIELERGRQQITCGGVYMLKAMQCMPGDVVEITRATLGWTAKQFSVISWDFRLVGEGDNLTLGIALELQETAAGVWDWANGEETIVDLAPNTTLPDPFTVAAPTSLTATSDATTTDLQADGSVMPRVRLDWTAPADINVTQGGVIRIEFKPNASADWRPWSTVRGDAVREFIGAVVIGTAYNFRVRSENNLAVPSSWVTVNLTAAGDTSGPATVASLTAVTGTGKAVSLDWPDSTEADLGEYEVQRSPAGAGTWAKLAEVRASRFVDVDVTIGTAYDYRVRAIDRSENAGAFSATATATPGTVSAGSLDPSIAADIAAAASAAATAISDAADAQATADGKVVTFVQTSAPTAEGVGDLWVDSDDSNKLYRWSGSAWVAIRDTGIATALTNAGNAQATADGKIVTFYQISAPTATAVGDLWVDTDDANRLYRWSGSAWVDVQGLSTTPPSNPAAPTLSSSTTYLSGDGTVFSKLVINVPAMPSGGYVLNLLYRKSGATGWIVADQRSTGGSTSDIDDLSPGVSYEVAVQAFSAFGVGSGIVDATGSPFAAPNKATASSPTSVTASSSASGAIVPPSFAFGVQRFGCLISWTAPTEKDVVSYDWVLHTSDTDADADLQWPSSKRNTTETRTFVYSDTLAAQYFRVRSVNATGVKSGWATPGVNLNTVLGLAAGSMTQQNATAVAITGGTIAGITDLALADGGTGASTKSGAQGNLGIRRVSHVETLGAAAVSFTFNHALGAVQDYILAQCVDPAGDVDIFHDYSAAGNDANNSVFKVFDPAGGTIGAGARRFTFHFLD
jgi:predicted phage tail protein